MYSRAERKFCVSDTSRTNPKLGPGSYGKETIQFGKKKAGYAPFSSLAPRISCFEDSIDFSGPAPGAYEAPNLLFSKDSIASASFFGKSATKRFVSKFNESPGPSNYSVPSTIDQLKNHSKNESNHHGLKSSSLFHPLTQQPLIENIKNSNQESLESKSKSKSATNEHSKEKEILSLGIPLNSNDLKLEAKSVMNNYVSRVAATKSAPTVKITWKRKHLPPSIPSQNTSFGYKETSNGDLSPRKPPKENLNETYTGHSISDILKTEKKGFPFGKSTGGRSVFKANEGPAPDQYDPLQAKDYLNGHLRSSAVMALSPCKRISDAIVDESLKMNVPGPASYNIKSTIDETIQAKRNRIKFSPGSYYPEFSDKLKNVSFKTQPFGSKCKRFEHENKMMMNSTAPGCYEIEKITSIVNKIKQKCNSNANPAVAFGSFSERFVEKQRDKDLSFNEETKADLLLGNPHKQKIKKIDRLIGYGPKQYKLGNLDVEAGMAAIPVFGSQANRFRGYDTLVPPPGSYELRKELIKTQSKGWRSAGERANFPPSIQSLPGPAEYQIPDVIKKRNVVMSHEPRFGIELKFKTPAPTEYSNIETAMKLKTFNSTLN